MRFLLATMIAIVLLYPANLRAHDAPLRVVVVGEDIDESSVSRDNEIYKRVVAQLQESLIKENITVIDEDMIAVKLGFSYNEWRSKQELIETLAIANNTTDATVQSRLGVIFAIFPNIQNMSVTRKLTVRVRGQIYDLKNLRALSSFEVTAPEAITIPLKASLCNQLCVEEKIGEVSADLARELGSVLIQKLHIVIEDSGMSAPDASTNSSVATNGDKLSNVYTVEFTSMQNTDVLAAIKVLEESVVREVELLKSTKTQRIYSVTSNKNVGQIEEELMLILQDLGVDIDRLRFSSFGNEVKVEAL